MLCLGNKEGGSFYTYGLHILDQLIRLNIHSMLSSCFKAKSLTSYLLSSSFTTCLSTHQRWQSTCSKFLKFKILINLEQI